MRQTLEQDKERFGLRRLSGVRQTRCTFSSDAVTTLDLQGFDLSTLTGLLYCFSDCSSLTTIYADPAWVLPPSGIFESRCFYSCSLVGGNGAVWPSGNTGYAYMRIDRAGRAGYLTAA